MEPSRARVAVRPAVRPVVLAFHKLTTGFSYSSTNYSPRRFERLLQTLQAAGFSFAPNGGETGIPAVITFDDGYEHLVDVLPPLMERYALQPLVFVPTALIGKPNRWDYSYWLKPTPHLERRSIKKLSQLGVQFGSHGHLHTDLTRFPYRRLEVELRQSRDILADLTGQPITSISYPFGRYNSTVLEAAEMAGLSAGYTMSFPSQNDSALAQGRFPIYGYDSFLSIQNKLGDGPLNLVERWKASITNRLSGGTVLLNRLRRFK